MQRSDNSGQTRNKGKEKSSTAARNIKKDTDLNTEEGEKPNLGKAGRIKELVCCGRSIFDSFNGLVSHKEKGRRKKKELFSLSVVYMLSIFSLCCFNGFNSPFLDAPAAFLGKGRRSPGLFLRPRLQTAAGSIRPSRHKYD